jgi:hypothetical protein
MRFAAGGLVSAALAWQLGVPVAPVPEPGTPGRGGAASTPASGAPAGGAAVAVSPPGAPGRGGAGPAREAGAPPAGAAGIAALESDAPVRRAAAARPTAAAPAGRRPATRPRPVAAAPAGNAAPAVVTPPADAALSRRIEAIALEVARLRGLAMHRPLRHLLIDPAAIRTRLVTRIRTEYSAAHLAAEELALERFALIPAAVEHQRLVVDLLTEHVAGFYDPGEATLFITGGARPPPSDALLAHEIVHALQDQHVRLRSFMKVRADNADLAVARQALVEGDGTALMIEYAMRQRGVPAPWGDEEFERSVAQEMARSVGGPKWNAAPLALREWLMFPYRDGLRFVAHFRRHHDWRHIDRLYRKPPLSSEHILHPDRYERYESPLPVTVPSLNALAGFTRRYDNVYGELGLYVLLRQHGVAEARARAAAAGWGGDRVVVLVPPSHVAGIAGTVGVSVSRWDEEADADEFLEALTDVLPGLSGGGPVTQLAEHHVVCRGATATSFALRRAAEVLLVVGVDAAQEAALARELLEQPVGSARRR